MTSLRLRNDLDAAAERLHPDSTSADIAQWARETEGLGHYADLRDGGLVDETQPDHEPRRWPAYCVLAFMVFWVMVGVFAAVAG